MTIRPSNRQIHPNYNAYHQKPKHKRVTHEFVDESRVPEDIKGKKGSCNSLLPLQNSAQLSILLGFKDLTIYFTLWHLKILVTKQG